MAIQTENIELLRALKSAGWDPNLDLITIDPAWSIGNDTPLTLAARCEAPKSIKWLLIDCEVSLEKKNLLDQKAIDIAIERENDVCLQILTKKVEPREADAVIEMLDVVLRKSMNKLKLKEVNDKAPDASWKGLDDTLRRKRLEKLERIPVGTADGVAEAVKKAREILEKDRKGQEEEKSLIIEKWHRVNDKCYEFRFCTSEHPLSGGGAEGRLLFNKYGYWTVEDVHFWDS